jgi:hypothetical protein
MRFILVYVLALVVASASAAAQSWEQCVAQPTRACVDARAKVIAPAPPAATPPNPYFPSFEDVRTAIEMARTRSLADAVALLEASAKRRNSAEWSRNAWIDGVRRFAWEVSSLAVQRGEESALVPLLQDAQALVGNSEPTRDIVGPCTCDPPMFVHPIMILVVAQVRAGKIEAALRLAHRMEKSLARAQVLASVSGVLARHGRTDEALDMARGLSDAEERTLFLQTLAAHSHYLATDREFLSGPLNGAIALLGGPTAGAGPVAAAAFDASMQIASGFATQDERDAAYSLIAVANAKAGDVANAARAAPLIVEPSLSTGRGGR